jgi:hypothetical protein
MIKKCSDNDRSERLLEVNDGEMVTTKDDQNLSKEIYGER